MKNVLFLFFGLLLLVGCEKEAVTAITTETDTALDFRSKGDKIDVCHYSEEDGTWQVINIDENAWPAHAGHGDVRLDDQDGDGFVPDNACDFGQQGDCDDKDASVNPDATEVCDNGVDDDCDGDVDEADSDCSTGGIPIKVDPDGTPGNNDDYTLYVHPTDNSVSIAWGGYGTDIPGLANVSSVAAANADFNGAANTAAIVDELGSGGTYAAKLCADLVAFGFDDWYLPAAGELNAMYMQLGPGGNNNFINAFYWSSTESSDFFAWSQFFELGGQFNEFKSQFGNFRCRCVRR